MKKLASYLISLTTVLVAACTPTVSQPTAPVNLPTATTTPAATPQGQPPECTATGQTWVSPKDGAVLVCVPAGEFLMGAAPEDDLAASDERPQHTVYLSAYWIDRLEISNAQFAQCVQAGACHQRRYSPYLWGVSSHTRKDYFVDPVYAGYPVIMLDGDEAHAYCQWAGRQLPTEAQWEKAARGNDGRLFPWGNEKTDCQRANYLGCENDTSASDSHPTGASPYGVLNMSGNVWEWVADRYEPEYYATAPAHDPVGPESNAPRGLRGGGWNSLSEELRLSARSSGEPKHATDGAIGFRCALR